jgi:multiple sugar transport system substrate-binding protein
MALLSRWGFADDYDAMYAQAAIDWRQFAGQTVSLAGASHPWSKAIGPLLPQFTSLRDQCRQRIPAETEYWAPANQACPRQPTPDVFMFYGYGLGIAAGWLERWPPLCGRVADRSGLV